MNSAFSAQRVKTPYAQRQQNQQRQPETVAPFAMLPLEIARDTSLSPGGKIVFAVILSLTRGKWRRCRVRNEKLAEMTGLCVTQVRRLLRDLEQLGLIARVMEGYCRLEINVTWTPAEPGRNPRIDYTEYLKSEWWKERRAKTLRADKNRCRLCNSAENLNVHHRSYENLGSEPDCDVITLCHSCHAKFHGQEGGEM